MKYQQKEHGALLIREGSQLIQIGSTLKCPHCGLHFAMVPGSGVERGWCHKHLGVTCGKPACDPCIDEEQLLERIEAEERFNRQWEKFR